MTASSLNSADDRTGTGTAVRPQDDVMSSGKHVGPLMGAIGLGLVSMVALLSASYIHERDKIAWASTYEAQKAEVERLKQQENALRPKVDELLPQSGTLTTEVEGLRRMRDALNGDIQSLKTNAATAEAMLSSAKAQLDAVRQESKAQGALNEQVKKEIAEQQAKLATLYEQLRDSQANLQTARDTEGKAVAAAKIAEREQKKADDFVVEAGKRKADTEMSRQAMLGQIEALKGTKGQLDADIKELTAIKGKIPDEEAKLRTLTAQRSALEQSIKDLTRDGERATADVTRLRKTETELMARVDSLSDEAGRLETRTKSLERTVEDGKKTVNERRGEIGTFDAELQTRREAAARALVERDALLGQAAEFGRRNEVLSSEVRANEAKLKGLADEIIRMKADYDKAADMLGKIRTQIDTATSEVTERRTQIGVASAEAADLRTQIVGATRELADLTARRDALVAEIRRLETERPASQSATP